MSGSPLATDSFVRDTAFKQISSSEAFIGSDPKKRSAVSYLRGMLSIESKDYESANVYLRDAIARDKDGQYAALARQVLQKNERHPPMEDARKGHISVFANPD